VGKARKGWFGQNWKWFVPLGCFGTLILFACIAFFLLSLVFGVLKSSPPYRQAMSLAQQDARVTAALGSPIEASRFISGNIQVSGNSGSAEFRIPISGPKAAGVLEVSATRSGERWVLEKAELTVTGTGERIDLLESAAPDVSPVPQESPNELFSL
jgi:hypothetical protein